MSDLPANVPTMGHNAEPHTIGEAWTAAHPREAELSGPARSHEDEFIADASATSAGFAQRVKALATTAPLHDLDARKAQVQTADYSVYQMAELALHAIDLVTIAMDFDTGVRPDAVLRDLATRVEAQAPGRTSAEHERVARWILESLLNVGSADRGFRTVYGLIRSGRCGTWMRPEIFNSASNMSTGRMSTRSPLGRCRPE